MSTLISDLAQELETARTHPSSRRRRGGRRVRSRLGKIAMYVVLVAAIVAGLATTVLSVFGGHSDVTYRDTVSPWFRSLFYFSPKIDSMAAAPLAFQIHTLVGMLLFTIWPFTRLVHAFTAPVHYLFRPYIVYRSRDARTPSPTGRPRAGWSPVGTSDRDRSNR